MVIVFGAYGISLRDSQGVLGDFGGGSDFWAETAGLFAKSRRHDCDIVLYEIFLLGERRRAARLVKETTWRLGIALNAGAR